ncbi:deleted in malignant brain tumors 1 -like isoform X2, partial [Paramuricea clavata]
TWQPRKPIYMPVFKERSFRIWKGKSTAIRLRRRPSSNDIGWVEVFYSGKWGTICDNSWDINDATVVCRQLGYKFGVRALRGSYIFNGTGQIWLDDVACTGNEQSLSSCSHNGWGNKNCGHAVRGNIGVSEGTLRRTIVNPLALCRTRHVVPFEGILCISFPASKFVRIRMFEFLLDKNLMHKHLSAGKSKMTCKGMGQGKLLTTVKAALIQSKLFKLKSKMNKFNKFTANKFNKFTCTYSELLVQPPARSAVPGVNPGRGTSSIPLRLQGPLSTKGTGRLEVFYNGKWGTVCDDVWDINDARVACRQLGYTYAVRALQGSDVPDGTGQIWLDDVRCTGVNKI